MNDKPNLFKIANKELSQDALLTWLLQWASPENFVLDNILNACGGELLKLLLTGSKNIGQHKVTKIVAGRQWEGIDIYAEIFFENDRKTLLIIEDKVHSSEHSNQLKRYREYALQWTEDNGFNELICAYVKIGGEPQRTIREIEEKGYKVYDRSMILNCLTTFHDHGNAILNDFIDHLSDMEKAYNSFQHALPNEWDGAAWVGFYQIVESRININFWHWVNNPAGGFWNLCLTWGYWHNFPVYMQIEQGRLCFKIAVSEDETGWDLSVIEKAHAQDRVQQLLFEYASINGFENIERPYPYVHRGSYRTFAIIALEKWRGEGDKPLVLEEVITRLKRYIEFYSAFMKFNELQSIELSMVTGI